MNVLPETIAIVGDDLRPVRLLQRMTDSAGYAESEFDQLIAAHADIIASSLASADIVEKDCTLRVLAQRKQVANIDVLLAEVAGDDLRRLVLVETKLFRNPEAHRTVLAQLLEYANTLQFDVEVDEILAKTDERTRAWLSDRRDDLDRLKKRGDFLLIICGDRIQPRLVAIAKPMLDRRDHVLSGIELALVSLALYEGDGMRVLVPNVVGAVTRGERDLCIEVTVRTEDGKSLPATVKVAARDEDARAMPSRGPKVAWTKEMFLGKVESPSDKGGLSELLQFAEGAEHLSVKWGMGAKVPTFTIVVEGSKAPTNVAFADSGAWVYLCRAQLANVLGAARATERVAALARRLAINVNMGNMDTVCLANKNSSFDVGDPRALQMFTEWLIEVRDEVLAAQAVHS